MNRRGRKPEIRTAGRLAAELRRQAKALTTAIGRLEQRLAMLDAYYTRQQSTRVGARQSSGRGPNVRDLAADVLERAGKPLAIAVLAPRVAKARGKKAGKAFPQNLATALRGDRRFRRVGRGLYSLK